jgi:hypothetical protein
VRRVPAFRIVRAATLACLLAAAARAQAADPVIRSDSLPGALRSGDPSALARVGGSLAPLQGVTMRVRVTPDHGRLGQALTYRGAVLVARDVPVRFEPPKSEGAFTWSRVRAGRVHSGWMRAIQGQQDSVWIEARLQVFEVGRHGVPGPVVQVGSTPRSARPMRGRLPTVRVTILPTVTPADSAAGLRALHGPIGAPWWERVPWLPVALALAFAAGLAWLVRRLRRRKPAPARPASAPAPVRARVDPAAEALRALATLRGRGLPASGRFAEHAFELTAILRRYLEATVATPRPGDTSDELLERLKASRMPEDDFDRLKGLLAVWDRVKFARAPLTEREAVRCEEAVEAYVRRVATARLEAARAAAAAPPATPSPGAPGAPPPPPPAAPAPSGPAAPAAGARGAA